MGLHNYRNNLHNSHILLKQEIEIFSKNGKIRLHCPNIALIKSLYANLIMNNLDRKATWSLAGGMDVVARWVH